MSKPSQMKDVADKFSALPGWPRFGDQSRNRLPRPSSSFFHEFRTRPIVLPIWLWNLLMIGLLVVFGGALLHLAVGLLMTVLVLLTT